MTDDELERHLQAWFRAEIAPAEAAPRDLRSALAAIPAAVPSPLVRPVPRRRIGLLAVAAVVTTLTAGGLLVASGAFRRSPDRLPNDPAFVAPTPVASAQAPTSTPTATATPFPTPSQAVSSPTPAPTPAAPPGPCGTGEGQFLTGDDRPPPSADPRRAELSVGQGVYVAVAGRFSNLWTVGPRGEPASLVAAATPEYSDVAVLDISPDGSSALVRVTLPPAEDRFTPGCSDLYLIPLDGSGVTRLTPEPEGGYVSGAAFSPDGTRVAFVRWSPMTVTVTDLATGVRVVQPCETGSDANDANTRTVAWSPAGTQIGAECGGFLFIVDPTGANAPFIYPRGDYTVAFRWADEENLVVARDPGGLALRGLHVDAYHLPEKRVTELGRVDAPNIEDIYQSFRFSPDGRWLLFTGGVLTAVPVDQIQYVGYVVPITGGTPTQVLTGAEADSLIGWSRDGGSVVFIGPDQTVVELDIIERDRLVVGTIPDGYRDGVWRIP